ncbi:MAG TPA: crosslink repair DNA glycosylase YcaQ family protein [Steroidobacteraceae bacterium]|nr:crosslink repair DNA glycosylase YcaQ family protein [Steroidobacteraceae bacterium]
MSQTLSLAEARRIALAAQLFVPAVAAPRGAAALGKIVHRLGAVQIDSVNVLVRSHYLPLFSRCGPYAPDLLERAAYSDARSLFEYWGHEASFLPVDLYPLLRWRMDRARNGEGTWKRLRRYATSHKQLVTSALEQIRERGALGASELADCGKSKGSWWGWSQGKEILEWLFWIGEVTTARRQNFERLYDLTERVLPERVLTASVPSPEQARRELMAISARALGVATAKDLRDYFRLPAEDAATRIAELVEQGTLQPVTVEGWKHQAYLHADAVCPRRADVSALLSPFDSLIWERQRTERLFGFYFRLEIYTPIHKRLHGYYVLPFLLGDRLVGRVDLKANRREARLEVRGGSVEEGVGVGGVVEPLAAELQKLAQWLGLEGIAVTSRRGELMRELKKLATRRASSATASRKGRQPRTA